jgi:hypothetical protein
MWNQGHMPGTIAKGGIDKVAILKPNMHATGFWGRWIWAAMQKREAE